MRKFIYSILILCFTTVLPTQAQEVDTLQGRKNIRQQCITVSEPTITIDLWDAGVEDNDTISLLLNGQWVLEDLRLAKGKQQFSFTLKPGDNELALFANNLGNIPNNTAALSINGGKKVSLRSGLESNGTMRLRYMAPGLNFTAIVCDTEELKDDKEAATIRSNPQVLLPSYSIVQTGIRLNADEPTRTVEIQDCYNSNESEVELLIWDCGKEDNDTISLYVNGTWVLQNFRLAKAKYAVPVKLNPGENVVLLYAHNLGDIPKNTAALSVKGKFLTHEVGTMISDENTCGAIRINYGFVDELGAQSSPCLDDNVVDSTSTPEMVYLNSLKTKPAQPSTRQNPQTPRPPQTRTQPPVIIIPPRVPPRTRPVPVPAPKPAPAPNPTPRRRNPKPDTPPPKPQH